MVGVSESAAAEQEPWLTTGEAAVALGVSRHILGYLIARGVLVRRENACDRRVKQIARAEVERVLRDGVDGMRPPRRKQEQGETAC